MSVGGGAPGDRTTEAAAGKAYLEERGVPTVAVGEGRNTLQSLEALSRTMAAQGWRSAVLVTDPWHSLRSRRMARDLGLDGGPLYDPLGNYREVSRNWNDWASDGRHVPVATRTADPSELPPAPLVTPELVPGPTLIEPVTTSGVTPQRQ